MPKRTRKTDPVAEWEAQAKARLDRLATYNAERARGIAHTPEYDERMAVIQERFDAEVAQEAQWEAEAHTSRQRKRINLT
jgi:hypothetical protein